MNHTKAGRKRSFRSYCDPDREGRLMDRAIDRARRSRMRDDLRRSLFRTGAMFLIGLVADKVMGAR